MRTVHRKVFCFALFLFLLPNHIGFAEVNKAKTIKIVASFYPVYIMAKNVTKDVPGVSVQNLTPPLTGCLHDYTVTPNDMRKLADAEVFVANGAGMESFLDKVIAQNPNLKIIQLSEGIPLIKGEGNNGDNPHVWVSISNAIIQVKNLAHNLEGFDPGHKELYARNADAYITKLEALKNKMHTALASYKGRQIITFHEAFSYFAQEFGLRIVAVIEREPGSEPSAKELADTITLVKKNGIAALFSEPQYPVAAAQAIAKETGAKIYVLDPAVTGPDDYDAYIHIMENNLLTYNKHSSRDKKEALLTNTCVHCCTKIENLTVRLGGTTILENVNLHVNCGEVIGVVGPNGAGKTTLLRTILGETAYQGKIAFRVGGSVSKKPKIGYVPQKLQFDLSSPISVADLVASAISHHPVWTGVGGVLLEKVKGVLSLFTAQHLLKRRIGELSGGELQRVLLAVAMTPEPELLLLDEPGSGVDVQGLSLFYKIVDELRKQHDIAVILVTHDLAGISSYADRVILLNRSVIAEGKPQDVLSDAKLVKAFGPSLWNISCLPNVGLKENQKNGTHH